MKIKTAYKIFFDFHKELMIYQEHAQTFIEFEEEKNKKYVLVDDLIKELDKVWHKINTCKMDKLRDNFITKTLVASYLSELRDTLTSEGEKMKYRDTNHKEQKGLMKFDEDEDEEDPGTKQFPYNGE